MPASINLIDNIALQTQKVEGVKFDKNYFINVIDAAKFFNLNYIWEPFTNTIEITDNNINLKMRLNSDFILVNNKIQISKNKLILNNGAIYLPLEFLIYLKNNIISISGNNV
ncbi:MAG TPA: stalk domain-containing protein, partial [bacterium]|nr:stalk domain-containing protein [bacterium]